MNTLGKSMHTMEKSSKTMEKSMNNANGKFQLQILPKTATFLYKLQAASRGVQFNTRSLEAGAGHRSELKEGGR